MEELKYLSKVNSTKDVKAFAEGDLEGLCRDIREYIIGGITENGGHLASNLGVVELTVAIHRVFDLPSDHLIFDVGHQCYTHKILTGRKEAFSTIRQRGGLSGFTKRSESEYDCFGAGHSSTSLSAAIGFAEADRISGKKCFSVAVVGDGAFSGGMIHEALNNLDTALPVVIILNENEMSISKNTGRFADLIAEIRSSKGYYKAKSSTRNVISSIPFIGKPLFRAVRKIKKSIKNKLYKSNYFENLGLYYLGPVDGNDVIRTERILAEAKNYGKACIVHVKTKKGKGYAPAEEYPDKYHGVSPKCADGGKERNFSAEAGEYLSRLADGDEKICAVTAAMKDGTGLSRFAEEHKDRFFDVGIAEEHALTFSAGLAADGMKPYFAVYSSFLQRGYDNLIHDIALQNLPVRILVDRAGLNSADGATHHGVFDVSFLSSVPGFDIYTPSTFSSLKRILKETADTDHPCAVRYPNGCDMPEIDGAFTYVSDFIRTDCDIKTKKKVIITYGRIAGEAMKAEKKLESCGIILLEKLTPYGKTAEILSALIGDDAEVLFLEEGIEGGSAGSELRKYITRYDYRTLAIGNPFVCNEVTDSIYSDYGIGEKDIIAAFGEKNG